MHYRSLVLAAAVAALGSPAAIAADFRPGAFFIAPGGLTAHGSSSLTAGVAWPAFWRSAALGGEWTAHAEGFISYWNAPQAVGGRKGFWQLGAVPILRYRFAGGTSPLFAEAGIGATVMDDVYTSRRKTFSTRFQFQDTLGVGMNLGARREHEIGVRFSHFSNAGIKKPNPGENFVQLRYAHAF
jgi:lipid A 3-O-deacylase